MDLHVDMRQAIPKTYTFCKLKMYWKVL